MRDKENVITHLQIIHTWAKFAREHDLQFFTAKHLKDIAQWTDDAITLLKEQEPAKPVIDTYFYRCKKCGSALCGRTITEPDNNRLRPNYCSEC